MFCGIWKKKKNGFSSHLYWLILFFKNIILKNDSTKTYQQLRHLVKYVQIWFICNRKQNITKIYRTQTKKQKKNQKNEQVK